MNRRLPARHIARQSLNLGWTFPELDLPDRIRAAAAVGFRNVECHFPYEWPVGTLKRALDGTDVSLVSINAPRGVGAQLGLAALDGEEAAFDASINLALDYATALGCGMIHVLAGTTRISREATGRLVANMRRAADAAAGQNVTLLLEPLNSHDEPGYFLSCAEQAAALIVEIGSPNVRMMFDVYHVGRMEADPLSELRAYIDLIGHVQIAAVPSHAEPDEGNLDYGAVYDLLDRLDYRGRIGAEYISRGDTVDGFGWLDHLKIFR